MIFPFPELTLGGTVVTPSPNLARHWKWRCNEAAKRAGETVWPTPDILSLHAWLERLWEQSLLAGGTAGQRNLLTSRQARFIAEDQLPDTSLHAIPGGRGSTVKQIMQGWQLCREWGISIRELDITAVSADERLFAEWAGRYESCVREQGWFDSWSMHRLVREDLTSGAIQLPGPVRFIGFDTVTPQLQQLADVLERLDNLPAGDVLWMQFRPSTHAGSVVRTATTNGGRSHPG